MPGLNLSLPNIALEIDASEVTEQLDRMRSVMEPEQFNRAMYGVMKRTAGHVKTILNQDVPKKYYAKRKDVSAAVQSPKVTTSTMGVGCVIPLSGRRLTVGSDFSATGGRRGWGGKRASKGKLKSVKAYKITAKIVKDSVSTLPDTMDGYGGFPPFRNTASSKVVFTRKTSKRLPVQPVVSVSVPQMPMNRSQDEIQADIKKYLKERIDARLRALIMNGR